MRLNYWTFPATERLEKDLNTKIENLLKRICESYQISELEIKSNRRLAYIVEPRKIAMYILHKQYNIPCVKVGNIFKKDHATVLHACRSISGFAEFDREFRNKVNNLV